MIIVRIVRRLIRCTSGGGTVRQRFFTLVDTALLDEDRARDWVVLRVVLNAVRELDEPSPDRDWITTNITVAKAVQG